MPTLRVWRCVGIDDLELLFECTPIGALFVLNNHDVLAEFVEGQFEGQLLTYREFEIALKR
jgi:hypothetical protein